MKTAMFLREISDGRSFSRERLQTCRTKRVRLNGQKVPERFELQPKSYPARFNSKYHNTLALQDQQYQVNVAFKNVFNLKIPAKTWGCAQLKVKEKPIKK